MPVLIQATSEAIQRHFGADIKVVSGDRLENTPGAAYIVIVPCCLLPLHSKKLSPQQQQCPESATYTV